jgi:oligoribonuclease NrnB/cAMP/cGMP phosphodiesterase (DHH superfamily)
MIKNKQKIQVVTHTDLDGVVSYLVLCWLYGEKLEVIGTTPMKLEQDYKKFIASKTFDKIYFLDLDVSKIGESIDNKNTIILDHHKTNLYPFKNAINKIYNETSCAKLIYDTLLKPIGKDITIAQKTLIALADDWDSNACKTPLSKQLNIVYHSMSNKFQSFVEDYYNGFQDFDKFKLNTITLYNKHCKEYIEQLSPYTGIVDFNDQKNIKVGAVFCDKYIQECCDWLLHKCKVDVAIAVIVNQQRIAVRRHPSIDKLDVSKFVQRVANGGGHEAAAGGNITEEFIEFTKMLKQIS